MGEQNHACKLETDRRAQYRRRWVENENTARRKGGPTPKSRGPGKELSAEEAAELF